MGKRPTTHMRIVTLFILTGVFGLSLRSVGVLSIALTTSMPLVTLPKTGC